MKTFWIICLCAASGCSAYTQAEMNLVAQARKGIALSQTSATAHQKIVEKLHELERRRLDEAFDADVRDQTALNFDWIVEHRKAYAAAIEALIQEKQSLLSSSEIEISNLSATDLALTRLEWLESIQMQFSFDKELGYGKQ